VLTKKLVFEILQTVKARLKAGNRKYQRDI